MKTITSKDLRNNMDKILERVNAGEEIIITHRYRQPVKLTLADEAPKKGLSGLAALDNAKAKVKIPASLKHGDLKEIYHKDLLKKYGK